MHCRYFSVSKHENFFKIWIVLVFNNLRSEDCYWVSVRGKKKHSPVQRAIRLCCRGMCVCVYVCVCVCDWIHFQCMMKSHFLQIELPTTLPSLYHHTFPLTFYPLLSPPIVPFKTSSSLQGCDLASFLLAVEDAADQDAFILGPGSSICHILFYPVTPLPTHPLPSHPSPFL